MYRNAYVDVDWHIPVLYIDIYKSQGIVHAFMLKPRTNDKIVVCVCLWVCVCRVCLVCAHVHVVYCCIGRDSSQYDAAPLACQTVKWKPFQLPAAAATTTQETGIHTCIHHISNNATRVLIPIPMHMFLQYTNTVMPQSYVRLRSGERTTYTTKRPILMAMPACPGIVRIQTTHRSSRHVRTFISFTYIHVCACIHTYIRYV